MAAAPAAQKAVPGDILLVVHEFAARSPDEITLHKGDRVELIERDDDFNDGWYLGRHLPTNQTGLFPEVYTVLAPQAALPTGAVRAPPISVTASDAQVPVAATAPAPASLPPATSEQVDQALRPGLQATPFGSRQPSERSEAEASIASETSGAHTPVMLAASPEPSTTTRRVPSGSRESNPGSTVMTETLSVIDEHITDMRQPGGNRSPYNRRDLAETTSEYSNNHSESRLSYIQGSESEAEEESTPTEKQVMAWSPQRVAEYLEDNGVERRHCDVFVEQEISGEVILTMDQATLFMKELELGPIGRRLKTWQRIKALQDVVKNRRTPTGSATDSPRGNRMSQHFGQHTSRPSAASVRSLGHARRQSSIDQAISESPLEVTPTSAHVQQGSLDRGWTMGNTTSPGLGPGQSPRPASVAHASSLSADTIQGGDRSPFPHSAAASQLSLATAGTSTGGEDRGYVSAADMDIRQRRVLQKKPSNGHDRTASHESGKRRLSFLYRRGWPTGSRSNSPTREAGNGPAESPVVGMDGTSRQMDSQRVVSEPGLDSVLPVRYEDTQAASGQTTGTGRERSSTATSSSRKGLRAISDAITGKERSFFKPSVDQLSPTTASTRSSTPSGQSKSFDLDDANKSQYSTSTTQTAPPPRRKDKKQTSAYLRGLEKKSPQEQMVGCDYSGWMKKKSSNLMTNWKPRLFVLRGRRLSYYYTEGDTEEQGLIDISGHRVLSADNERLTGLHASLTGATTSPTSPQMFSMPAMSDADSAGVSPITPASSTAASTPKEGGQGFIFKLVPPRSGMSKAVNFTKPTVHYFAVPSVEEGRLWMAALMKATIDRDDTIEVVTTYQQKTISLAKARARKERPPALKNLDEEEDQAAPGGDEAPPAVASPGTDNDTLATTTAASAATTSATEASIPTAQIEESQASATRPQGDSQVTEVTDLESPASPGGKSMSLRMSRRLSAARRTTSQGSGTGLGIDGLSEPGGSPIVERMNNAGLW